jgi:hypothetical protein
MPAGSRRDARTCSPACKSALRRFREARINGTLGRRRPRIDDWMLGFEPEEDA